MRTFIHSLFFSLFAICLAVSCGGRKAATPVVLHSTMEVKETVHDTVFKTKADSAFYYSWIECQNNKPVLLQNSPSGNLPSGNTGKNISAKVDLQGNVLKVSVQKQAEDLFAKWKEKYISEQKEVPVPQPVEVEKKLHWWQKLLMWAGGIFIIQLAVGAYFFILKFFK